MIQRLDSSMRGLVVQRPDSSARDGRWWGRMTGNNGLPEGWVKVRLGDITEPSRERVNPEKLSGVPYIGLEHIEKETGRLLGKGISEDVRSTKAVFHSGDLLYGKLRPYLNKVYIPDFDGVCSTDILVFPRNEKVDNKYLFYRFMSSDFVRYANRNVSGVQHPRVSLTTLAEFEIEYPPRPEQERIVARIEETFTQLEAGVAELQNAKAQLKRYRAAVLKSAVEGELTREWRETHQGEIEPAKKLLARILSERREKWEAEGGKGKYKEPAAPNTDDLPKLSDGWVWTNTGQLCDCIVPNRDKPKSFSGDIPWITLPDFDDKSIRISKSKSGMGLTEEEARKYKAKIIPKGSVVMSCVGRFGITSVVVQDLVVNQQLHAFLVPEKMLEAKYLAYIIKTQVPYMEEIATATTIAYLNKSNCNSVPIPLPPLDEQRRIVEKVERRLSVADEIEKELDESLVRAERLRGSVLKSAFEGRLV
jgi:type I restriction enzyme S subunit